MSPKLRVIGPNLKASLVRSIGSLKSHFEDEDVASSDDHYIYLLIRTHLPTSHTKEFVPRIIPLPCKIGEIEEERILLVTKDPISTYKEPITKRGSVTENTFDEIISFQKFRQQLKSRSSVKRLYHNNDFILIDHRLQKLIQPLLRNTPFEKSGNKYPKLVQMAKPSAHAVLVRSKKSPKMKDERVDPEYLLKQVKMIVGGTTFIPSKGDLLSVVMGSVDMDEGELLRNADRILYYLTDLKMQPVGGVIREGMDGIDALNVKMESSVSLPVEMDS